MDLTRHSYICRRRAFTNARAWLSRCLSCVGLGIGLLLLPGCLRKARPPLISQTLTLAASDSSAMGACVFQHFYKNAFVNTPLSTNIRPFDRWYKQQFLVDDVDGGGTQVYCAVAPALKTWRPEAEAMADFVERGNVLLLASNAFEPGLLELFGLEAEDGFNLFGAGAGMKDTYKTWADSALSDSSRHGFYFYPLRRHLKTDSSLMFTWLSVAESGIPDAIRLKFGKGELVLVTNAAAFCNYFLLQGNNHQYAQKLLSYLPETAQNIVWDDFYRRYPYRQAQSQSMLSALMSNPHLRMAMLALLLAALAWMVTNLFRRQRKIAILKPNVNTSLEFSQTIARLYFNRKDNQNIAQKMLVYFNDWLHQKYFMHPGRYDEQFVNSFSAKSGMALAQVELLASTIHTVQHNATVSNETLLVLNQQIQMAMAAQPGG